MRNISRGLDCPRCPFQVGLLPIGRFYNRDRPVISLLQATHSWFRFVVSFCNSRRPFWAERGKWAQSAQLYISPGCLSLSCILHRHIADPARSCILWCQPLIYYYCVLYIIHRYVLYILSTNSEKQTEQNIPVPTSWSWLKTLDIQEMKFSKTSQTVYSNDHWLMTSRRVLGGPMLMTPLCCLRDASPPNARFWLLRPVTLILVCVCFSNLTTFKLVCTHSEFTPVVAL